MRNRLLVLFVFFCATAQANDYYFSTNSGDDNRSSSQAQNPSTPWRSINKLNSFFTSLSSGDKVYFKRGETFYGSIIVTKSDITLGAYGSGAKPVITGFSDVPAWTPSGGGVYEYTCATCPSNLNMVTFQNVLQPMGRWPKLTAPHGGYLMLQSHSGTSSITSNEIASALNYVGGEIVIRKRGWIIDRARITNQTSSSVFYSPLISPSHPFFTYEPIDGYGFFFKIT